MLENGCLPPLVMLLSAVPPPHTKAEMCSFLGMTNYRRYWIHGYTEIDFVFHAGTLDSASEPIQ